MRRFLLPCGSAFLSSTLFHFRALNIEVKFYSQLSTSRNSKMSSEAIHSEIARLRSKLGSYQAGSIEGLKTFNDALPGEMEGMQIRIAVFGMTGSGKSALVNTIWKVLYGKESSPAIVQSSGAEGTQLLEDFHSEAVGENELGGFVFNDTRGFGFDFNNAEENELFRVLYGIVSAGNYLERGDSGTKLAKTAGRAACKLEKPPVADQVHVVLWVIKANDVRFTEDLYRDKFDFVRQMLNREGVTIVTVVTHDDRVSSQDRNDVKKKAMEVTGSSKGCTFLIANWLSDQEEYEVEYRKNVLKMVYTALGCGERCVRTRQVQRKLSAK